MRKGTKFTGLVGIEYDRVNPVYPVERPIEVLSHSPLNCRGVNSYSDSAYYTHRSGAGVFNTGTMRWVACSNGLRLFGLTKHAGEFTRQVAANLLHAFADGPAAAKYPAHDNLGLHARVARRSHRRPAQPLAAGRALSTDVRHLRAVSRRARPRSALGGRKGLPAAGTRRPAVLPGGECTCQTSTTPRSPAST